jgi:hypothetical protein
MSGAGDVRTPCAITDAAVFELLAGGRFDLTTEAATQRGMEQALLMQFPRSAISREHRLGPGDRPDFLIDGRIVVEVKGPRHRAPAVLRQLQRYAEHDQVEAIILATSRAMAMPWVVGLRAVPLRVINLGRAWL